MLFKGEIFFSWRWGFATGPATATGPGAAEPAEPAIVTPLLEPSLLQIIGFIHLQLLKFML